jgi:hypothetical protein
MLVALIVCVLVGTFGALIVYKLQSASRGSTISEEEVKGTVQDKQPDPSRKEQAPTAPQESPAARWARELKEIGDYVSLARIYTETGSYDDRETEDKRDAADSVLRSAGSEAVDAILAVLDEAEQGWLGGKAYLARTLCDIGDSRAIPLLKTLLNRGRFSTGHEQAQVRQFVDSHPELWRQEEIVFCLRCEKQVPVSETEFYGDSSGREWRLCPDCWMYHVDWMIKLDQKDCSSLAFSRKLQAPPISPPKIVSPAEAAGHVNSQEKPGQPAPAQKTPALPADAKDAVNKLVQKAVDCWGGYGPVWLSRAAVILAEAGNQKKSTELLERALRLVHEQRDPIQTEFDLMEVAESFGSAASAAGDPQMFQRGLHLIAQISQVSLRACTLANVFGYLYRTGDHRHAASVKEQLLSDIERLQGLDYSNIAREAVKPLVKNPSARDEAAKLLETALKRGKSDNRSGQTIDRKSVV